MKYCMASGVIDAPKSTAMDVGSRRSSAARSAARTAGTATSGASAAASMTGAVPWRRPGVMHKANEVYLDIAETLNMTFASNGKFGGGKCRRVKHRLHNWTHTHWSMHASRSICWLHYCMYYMKVVFLTLTPARKIIADFLLATIV